MLEKLSLKQAAYLIAALLGTAEITITAASAAVRDYKPGMTRAACRAAVGGRNWGSSSMQVGAMGAQNKDTLCFYDGTDIPVRWSADFSYARDTLQANHIYPAMMAKYDFANFPQTAGEVQVGYSMKIDAAYPAIDAANGIYQLQDGIGFRLTVSGQVLTHQAQVISPYNTVYDASRYRERFPFVVSVRNLKTEIIVLDPEKWIGKQVHIPRKVLGELQLDSANYSRIVGNINRDIIFPATTIEMRPRTCVYQGVQERTVKMDKIGVGHFKNKNLVYGGETVIELNCREGDNVDTYINFTDALNPNNTTNTLTIESGGSMAQGVGIRLFLHSGFERNLNDPIKFSPLSYNPGFSETSSVISIARNTSTQKQFASATPNAQTHQMRLSAFYEKTGRNITPGLVKGAVQFNFAYY